MSHHSTHSGINIAKIPVAGLAGGIFTIGALSILVIGIPELRIMLPAAIAGGVVFALVLRFTRRDSS